MKKALDKTASFFLIIALLLAATCSLDNSFELRRISSEMHYRDSSVERAVEYLERCIDSLLRFNDSLNAVYVNHIIGLAKDQRQ